MRPSVTARTLFVVACVGAVVAGTRAQPADDDLLITSSRVLDGAGNPFYIADVAVKAGRSAAIGKLRNATARRTIDARNPVRL